MEKTTIVAGNNQISKQSSKTGEDSLQNHCDSQKIEFAVLNFIPSIIPQSLKFVFIKMYFCYLIVSSPY